LSQKKIVFFDGVCNLCNGFVDFLLRVSFRNSICVASLQGAAAAELLSAKETDGLQSVIYFREGRVFEKSTAVIRILSDANPIFSILLLFLILPRAIRDGVYDFVAHRRYGMFGKRETCRLPSPEEKERFLP
jgi:predicted DCC family thiol-disulfide oxidoreductase YuxK